MNIPGEGLPKVFHYFKEGHPYFDKDVAVIGGKNSSVDAALELVKSGARVTVLYRGHEYSRASSHGFCLSLRPSSETAQSGWNSALVLKK